MKKIVIVIFLFINYSFAQEINFKKTTPLNLGRQMYGSVILGDYIYVISGNRENTGLTPSVEMAKIMEDGSIGQWQETTPIPNARSYIDNSTLALNDIVYIVAGKNESLGKPTNTILWTRPKIDGNLEQWRESIPFPGPGIQCAPSIATPGYIHLLGGLEEGQFGSSKVWSAKISNDGSIIAWEQGSPLPVPLWYHCGGVAGGKVWIWGGSLDPDKKYINQRVYFAPILSSGKIGQWQLSSSNLQQGLYASPCTVSGGYLISFCPRYTGDVFSSDIWYAYVYPNGLSEWKKNKANINAKVYIGLSTDYRRGLIYIPGGRVDRETFDFDKNTYFIKLASGQKTDINTDAAATIDQNQQRTQTSRLSYVTQSQTTQGILSGFIPYEEARQKYANQAKKMIIYFHSEKANKCLEQTKELKSFDPAQYMEKVIFADLETVNFPQISQQYGIFRVPCWIFFDVFGNERYRKVGIMESAELDNLVKQFIQ